MFNAETMLTLSSPAFVKIVVSIFDHLYKNSTQNILLHEYLNMQHVKNKNRASASKQNV